MPAGHAALRSPTRLPELLGQILALLRAAGDPDNAKVLDLADLSDNRADGARGRGHDERLAGFRLADFEESEIRRPTRHAESANPPLERRLARVDLERPRAVDNRVALHAEDTYDRIALTEVRMSRRDHVARGVGAHHVTQADWRGIGLRFAHPPAHGRIERHELRVDLDLAVSQRRNGLGVDDEVLARGHAARAAL
jgi:hypothetical protein